MAEAPRAADLALLDPDGSFALRLAEDRAALGSLARVLDGTAAAGETRDGLAAIELIAHRLAGAAGTFGHAAVSAAALDLEAHVIAQRKGNGRPRAAALGLAGLLAALDRAVAVY